MKLLLIGGLAGLMTGVGLTILYFSLSKFFTANARALNTNQKAAEQMARETEKTQPPPTNIELVASQNRGNKTSAKMRK